MKENKNELEAMNKEILLKSGLVHDLRNLLMVIKEVLEQIKSSYQDNIISLKEEIYKKINYACSICNYCIYLSKVKDLFKKLDPNDINNEGFDLTEAIKSCQKIFDDRALYDINKHNLKVIFEEKDDKFQTIPMNFKVKSMSEIQFKTVLINFLSNAYKYTDTGSIKIKTRIFKRKKKEKKQKLRIMVEDSGVGFKGIKIDMNKPYHFHDKSKKNKEGSGFGLYMVAEILKMIGSEIKYKTSDTGSIFYFDIFEKNPLNEMVDLDKLYSNYLRKLINDINSGKKDNETIICNLEQKISLEEDQLKAIKSPKINEHKLFKYAHDNNIINLLTTNKKLSIIQKKTMRKQISVNKVLSKEDKSLFIIDKKKIQGLSSFNYNNEDETFRDNENIDAIDDIANNIEEDLRPLFTIIICDDEGLICESIKRVIYNIFNNNNKLDKYKLNLLSASDGIRCLNVVSDCIIKNVRIKFILMDNSMPFLDGISTCNILKNTPVLNQDIYLLSGDDDLEDCKADGFLVKPIDEKDLTKIINKYC